MLQRKTPLPPARCTAPVGPLTPSSSRHAVIRDAIQQWVPTLASLDPFKGCFDQDEDDLQDVLLGTDATATTTAAPAPKKQKIESDAPETAGMDRTGRLTARNPSSERAAAM